MSTLALIPARGGSKGLPGKNLAPLGGLPLIVHSLRLAALCPEIGRTLVSTDDAEIARVARAHGGEVLDRPEELAQDETPMWPVVRHALAAAGDFDLVLLLDPTSPARLPGDVARAHELLARATDSDGCVGVSQPHFNPIWHCVVERDGYMAPLFDAGSTYTRRQDVPAVYRINASLYLWRSEFVRGEEATWQEGRHVLLEIPELRAVHIDEPDDLRVAQALLDAGLIELPWLS